MKTDLWLIGTGEMATQYSHVLNELNKNYEVIGRGKKSSDLFLKTTGVTPITGGLKLILKKKKAPLKAIIAVNIRELKNAAKYLILAGTKKILLEKPGALNFRDLNNLNKIAIKNKAKIMIAYNRRFYSSVQTLKKLSKKDGGIKSVFYEFTEMSNKIEKLRNKKYEKSKWVLSNSSHVIDLAFYLTGVPKKWNYFHNGSLSWHTKSAIFSGSGITSKKILFSYHANWKSPGRWGLEIMTNKNRYILKPLEELKVIEFNNNKIKKINLNNKSDKVFKPGLFLQTKEFLNNNFKNFCHLKEQIKNLKLYNKIAGY